MGFHFPGQPDFVHYSLHPGRPLDAISRMDDRHGFEHRTIRSRSLVLCVIQFTGFALQQFKQVVNRFAVCAEIKHCKPQGVVPGDHR